jgi:hypothetical protein
VGSFSGTSLPPIVRVGNSADAIHAPGRDTAVAGLPTHLVGPTRVRSEVPVGPAIEVVSKRRLVKNRRAR